MSRRIGIVTCRELPEPDPDQDLMLGALRKAGMDAELLPWDDGSADPSGFDLCVLRSCWDYHRDPDRFMLWVDEAEQRTTLRNPAEVVRWNIHKRYLFDMEAEGLPIVPTAFVDRGEFLPLDTVLAGRGWTDIVIKPCISAGSANTKRFHQSEYEEADAFLFHHAETRDMMIQPYLPSVESGGERSIIWIGGEATHVIEKHPRFAGQDEQVSDAKPVEADEQELIEKALSLITEPLMYARLDTMLGPSGERLVSEFELIEPSLFLLQSEKALRAFVSAVEKSSR